MTLALIVGAGSGLSASLARLFHAEGYGVALAARNVAKLADLAAETSATCHALNAADPGAVAALFAALPEVPRVVVYNPSARQRGPIATLDPEAVREAITVTAFGAFLVGQAAAKEMLAAPPEDGVRGTILFTGASAGVKGFAQSAPFAMGKFAQRGLAQSMSRELHPQGIHVAWINIDGGIRTPGATGEPDALLDPAAIAQTYLALVRQHRSAWSEELAVRPYVERF